MKLLIEISLDLSASAQVLYHLIKTGQFELADKYEARFSIFDKQPGISLRQELIQAKLLLNNPDKLEDAIVSSRDPFLSEDLFILDLIDDYRSKFKNKKTGAQGSKTACIKKFKLFFKENPDFIDKQLILDATDRYINACRKDGFKFIMQADYFIYKIRPDGGGNVSTLATYCEEVRDTETTTITNSRLLGL